MLDAVYLNQPIHSSLQAAQVSVLFVMYRSVPTTTKQGLLHPYRLLSTLPYASQQLVLHYTWYDVCVISDACLHKWPAASRAELLPSVWAVTMLKHPKPPLLVAAQSRCGSFFSCKTICEVREGQAWGDPGSLQAVFPNGGHQQAARGAA